MGNITTTMALDHEAMASHSVTVTATVRRRGSDSITVTIAVGNVDECEDAGADGGGRQRNGLMADCEILLGANDTLMGDDATRMLDWSVDTPIADAVGSRRDLKLIYRFGARGMVVPPWREPAKAASLTLTNLQG